MREKLIELIKSGAGINHNGKCDICQTADCIGCLADYLIAHGVNTCTSGEYLPREETIKGVLEQMQTSASPKCMEEFLRNLNGVTLAKDNNLGCKYCAEYADLPEHFGNGNPVGRVFDTCIQHDGGSWHLEPTSGCDIGIKYCPMCGRLLPEPPKEEEE